MARSSSRPRESVRRARIQHAFGPDVKRKGQTFHTLWVSNDNDFVNETADTPPVPNPNQFFVFGFTDGDLGGSVFVPQFAERGAGN